MRRSSWWRGLFVVTLSLSLFALTPTVDADTKAEASNTCKMWLKPKMANGPVVEEHRHWLEMSGPFNGKSYTIVNMTYNQSYHFDFWDNLGGIGKFGVPTRYTLLHKYWYNEAWLLVCQC